MGWGGSDYKASPTPSIAPGVTNVSQGANSSSNSVQAMYAQQLKKRRGYSSTIRSQNGASMDQATNGFGKTLLGE